MNLTDRDVTNLEKIASLRGHIGKLRREIATARDILQRYEHRAVKPDYPLDALLILSRALESECP